GGAVLRRVGAALPGGPDRLARRRPQLRIDLSAPRRELARDRRHRHLDRPTAGVCLRRRPGHLPLDLQNRAHRLRPPGRALPGPPTAGSTNPCSGTGPCGPSSTSPPAPSRPPPPTSCGTRASAPATAPSTAGRKKRPQQRRGPHLLDPAVHLRRVVTGG